MTMPSVNSFSYTRLSLLCRHSFIINKRIILVSLAGVTGAMILALFFLQTITGFRNWDHAEFLFTFIVLFILLGIIYGSSSFPAFRSKEKSLDYLMLPANPVDKFIFEFIVRIAAFIIVMPLLYWIAANIEAYIAHSLRPILPVSGFSFSKGISVIMHGNSVWHGIFFSQIMIFFLVSAFTGAAFFTSLPLIKNLFTLTLVFSAYSLYTYSIFRGFGLDHIDPAIKRVFFIHTKNQAYAFFSVAILVINMTLIVVSWFRLKEKEV